LEIIPYFIAHPGDDKNFFIGMQMDENDEPTKPSGVQCLNYINEINL
jgi:hypothetical protein